MHVAILDHEPAQSAYVAEILTTWGVRFHRKMVSRDVFDADAVEVPILIAPAVRDEDGLAEALERYMLRGGTVICMHPDFAIARLAGLVLGPEKSGPMRLRLVAPPLVGPAGQTLVVVPPARYYEIQAPETRPFAFLSPSEQYVGESIGVSERPLGQGCIIAFAFDLPRCVMLLRQGSPDRQEWLPEGIEPRNACARASHLAVEVGGAEATWSPFADLLCQYLVALVLRHATAPLPLLSHLPGEAQGIVLLSGDEDYAAVDDNDYQMSVFADAGVKMNLYVIPEATQSTPQDVARYRHRHDIGIHPNLRPLDGKPIADRVADFERQIHLFEETYRFTPMSVRNHCFAWAGYLELIEVEQRCGVRMDANFASGAYRRYRRPEPFFPFGAAMPMRFCQPDGRLMDVFQQHTHICDDISFSPDAEYSHKYTPQAWAPIFARILNDMLTGGHYPFTLNFHPGNWRKFAEVPGREILRQAAASGVPVWSFDQWCRFWEARDTWRIEELTFRDKTLRFKASGKENVQLRWLLPSAFGEMRLTEILLDGVSVPIRFIKRYGETAAQIAPQTPSFQITARYTTDAPSTPRPGRTRS